MEYFGNILKMQTTLLNNEVQYSLPIAEQSVDMNKLIGTEISITHTGKINCVHCQKVTKKSYFQGFCYHCYSSLPQTDENILHPEKDRSYLGESRDIEWAKKNTLTPHFVYLALTSNIKVGVTRSTQVPTRWIDQGASNAIIIAQTPNRHIAGVIEVFLKDIFADKTKWQQMLSKTNTDSHNLLIAEKHKAKDFLHKELLQYFYDDNTITQITYPISELPNSPKAINFDKTTTFLGKLTGIKGQYLIFENNSVLNIRKHGGYELKISTNL